MVKLKFRLIIILFTVSVAAAEIDSLFLQPGALEYCGVYTLREYDPNLTGRGVQIAAICRSYTYVDGQPQGDFAIDPNHRCFSGEQINFYNDPNVQLGTSLHSTAIAGILIGDDDGGFYETLGRFYYEGAVPKAGLDIFEFWHFVKNNVLDANMPDADILTISVGSSYEDWWTRGIEKMAERGMIVVAGVGNGSAAFDPLLYPGASSNAIGVGVVDCVVDANIVNVLANFGLARSEHSSMGPTADGICKPDIVAPGNCLVPDGNDGYVISGNWSSFATPVVSGCAGLLVQKAKETPSLAGAIDPNGGNCVIKAILMNSADKLPYWHKGMVGVEDDHKAALDCVQGAGVLNAIAAMDTLMSDEYEKLGWVNDNVAGVGEKIYKIKTDGSADEYITATLVWNRHYQDDYPFGLVRAGDLRLEVWAVDYDDPNKNYMLDYSDCNNGTVEHIYYPADQNYTDYEIVVSSGADANEAEQFGLAWEVGVRETAEDDILYYDINNDGVVGDKDFVSIIENLGRQSQSAMRYLIGDIDMNGTIEMVDLEQIMKLRDRKAEWKK